MIYPYFLIPQKKQMYVQRFLAHAKLWCKFRGKKIDIIMLLLGTKHAPDQLPKDYYLFHLL